ncbi:MerR family transcriptional regulator [Candidatus Babeliales bacterium]|nr:MerR family transcriptional regulator [Candidatus Babeliales bacterium]
MAQETRQMSQKKFRIGDLSRKLQVKKFVIRFWEKEFALPATRSEGGQRYYTQNDLKTFNTIKYLLYNQGFTISGAKSQLSSVLKKPLVAATVEAKPEKADVEPREIQAATKTIEKPVPYIPKEFLKKIAILKDKLEQFKQVLG